MAQYGGKRSDFQLPTHALALGENWPLRWAIEDENGTALSSFTGLTWGFAILDQLTTANGWTAVLAAALHSETSAGGGITASVPNVDVTVTAVEQAAVSSNAGLTVRPYAYELWELTNVRRVAYGLLVPIA